MKWIQTGFLLSLILSLGSHSFSQSLKGDIIAWWDFENIQDGRVEDRATGIKDQIKGNYKILDGVTGKALKFDGFTTRIRRDSEQAPVIKGAFSVQAWVAPQAYPWNWCAVVNQEYQHQRGFFFGIDAEGRVGFHAAITRQWRQCISQKKIPFMEWSFIAATYDPESGINLFIDGEPSGSLAVQGDLLDDIEMDMQIGRNHERMIPASLNRAGRVRMEASYSFDGLMDELKIFTGVQSAREIRKAYQRNKPNEKPRLKWRKLPDIPTEKPDFGAFYTKLKYDADWDALWRDDQYPDIVVTFPGKNYSMVFWKGTNYNMNLVTENGKWIADQSVECWGENGAQGCCEHMSDKQNRYSHVRIIENSDARVVVHWRYALTDIAYRIANVDPITNWGDWVDEYYTIYPDGIAVRHFLIHGKGDDYSITEPAVLSNPGEKAEDNVMMTAVTLANLKGETSSHSYQTWPGNEDGAFSNAVTDAVLSIVNLKSETNPFYIYEPGTTIIPYGGGPREIDTRYSKFHSRNHWPVSQVPCDGRFVLAADRVTSSAITSPEPPMKRRSQDQAWEGRFIMGLSEQAIEALIPFAQFWLNTPAIKIIDNDFSYNGFTRNERAYRILKKNDTDRVLNLKIYAGSKSPVVNPVFIIENWGKRELEFLVDQVKQSNGKDFRYSIRKSLDRDDLIVWVNMETQSEVHLTFVPSF